MTPRSQPPKLEHLAPWLIFVRQIILFALGVFVILDSVLTPGTHITELIVGLLLLGIVPLDTLMTRIQLPGLSKSRESDEGRSDEGEGAQHHDTKPEEQRP
jgi:hypothetical protein